MSQTLQTAITSGSPDYLTTDRSTRRAAGIAQPAEAPKRSPSWPAGSLFALDSADGGGDDCLQAIMTLTSPIRLEMSMEKWPNPLIDNQSRTCDPRSPLRPAMITRRSIDLSRFVGAICRIVRFSEKTSRQGQYRIDLPGESIYSCFGCKLIQLTRA